jgi:rhodanese-related sulfurtransferase
MLPVFSGITGSIFFKTLTTNELKSMKNQFDRRSFLRISALTGAFMGIPQFLGARSKADVDGLLGRIARVPDSTGKSVIGLKVAPIKQVRVGIIGLGARGSFLTMTVAALCPDKAKIVAICDLRESSADAMAEALKAKGQHPVVYKGSEDIWKQMVARDDLDLVLVCTPWELHAPMAIEAMRCGKHTAVEVPAAINLQECWDMVNTAEETQRNCMILENCCYGDEELWVLNMVRAGVFGTITYGEAAYIHRLRMMLFGHDYYNQWRMRHNLARDGNLYPTHGLGPVAQYMDIQRGDRFDYLVSQSSLQATLSEYAKTVSPDNEFYNRTDFKHGDMNTCLIKTAKGRMIHLYHDVVTPRPYSRKNSLAGTHAYHEGYTSRLCLSESDEKWMAEEEYQAYRTKYRHPVWDRLKDQIARNNGHGGMDFVEIYRLIDNLNRGVPLDMDVYDAAAWSVVTPLSEISVELGSVPVKFPDFTRGRWKEERELQILID